MKLSLFLVDVGSPSVSKLFNNLSIHKVTQNLNYAVVFFHSNCVFQDVDTGKTIGIAKELGRLYYLQHEENKECARLQALTANLQLGLESSSSSQYGFKTIVLVILHLVP